MLVVLFILVTLLPSCMHGATPGEGSDADRFAVLKECTENYGVGSSDAEWPNNMLSRKLIVYGDGTISGPRQYVRHQSSPEELALCQQLSQSAKTVVGNLPVGMGSESSDPFQAFFVARQPGRAAVNQVDADFIRHIFNGTIFPHARIVVEPLLESGSWWEAVRADCDGDANLLLPWRSMMAWFQQQDNLRSASFVQINDPQNQRKLPAGTVLLPAVLPRLAVALTEKGSLVGLFGFSVQAGAAVVQV